MKTIAPSTQLPNPQGVRWILLGIISLALVIHLWGIQKNLPYIAEADESIFVERAVKMAASGNLDPAWFGNPGSTIFYPLAFLYHAWYAVTQYGMFFRPDPNLQVKFSTSFWEFYLLGRLLSVAYTILSIPLIYLIGKRTFGGRVGLAGAWLFVFYTLAIYHAQMVRTDSVALFWTLASLWYCLRISAKPTRNNHLLAGLAIGLGIASRYFLVTLVPILLIIDSFMLWQQAPPFPKKQLWVYLALGLFSIGAAFAFTTPYFFLDFKTALENIRFEARSTHLGADGLSPLGNFVWYVTNAIPTAISWPQTILAMVGGALIYINRQLKPMVLLTFGTIFLMGISLSPLHWARWIIQVLPLLALFAAYGLDALLSRLSQSLNLNLKTQQILMLLGLLLLSTWPAYQSVLLGLTQANPGTRILARAWVLENLPAQSHIAQESYTAPLTGTNYVVLERFSLAEDPSLQQYYRAGYHYLLVSNSIYDRYFAEPSRYAAQVDFYHTLFTTGKLLQKFIPSPTRGGPIIQVYELQNPKQTDQ